MTPAFARVNGMNVHYRLEGTRDAPAPVVVLCHGLLGSLAMWEPQIDALTTRYRVLRFDNRGHGSTEVTPPPYSVAQLAEDAIGLMDALRIARAHFVGCSLGGMIGQELGARHPDRLASLVLVGSRSVMPPASMWDQRVHIARTAGIAPLLPTMLERWFTPAFRATGAAMVQTIADGVLATPVDGFVGACMAIREMDHSQLLSSVAVPTLVASANDDPGVPVEDTTRIRDAIPDADMTIVEGARHLFSIERAELFNALLLDWLARH